MHTYYFTPTDRAASSLDEFLAISRSIPEVASDHLTAGWFDAWLRDEGRADLADRAAELRFESDALDRFLKAARPARARRAPKAAAADPTTLPARPRASRKKAA
jgi:hypothetical protein